jgi:hypothetical protein
LRCNHDLKVRCSGFQKKDLMSFTEQADVNDLEQGFFLGDEGLFGFELFL